MSVTRNPVVKRGAAAGNRLDQVRVQLVVEIVEFHVGKQKWEHARELLAAGIFRGCNRHRGQVAEEARRESVVGGVEVVRGQSDLF